ncbi:MAG TPA: ABC transporter permease, partial [Mucilaginibacter sp.]|nr:ABC transporter permease [Mucilaginibacter sp.]
MFKNYLKTAFRGFRRHKLFTFINIIGLSIGISAALVIFLIVYHDFTFDKFHKDGNRIYRVVSDYNYANEPFYNSGVTGPLPEAIRNEVTGVQLVAPYYTQDYKVLIPGKTQVKFKDEENIIYANERFFGLLSFKWLAGSAKQMSEPDKVILSSEQAHKYFPSLSYDQVLGKQVVYGDSIRTTVAGVIQTYRENSDFKFTDYISFSTIEH